MVTNSGGEDDDDGYKSERTLFAENDQAYRYVSILISNDDDNDTSKKQNALTSLRAILDRYLEAPTLLDPYLAALVTPLGDHCRDALVGDQIDDCCFALSAIYSVSKVRGRKRIAAFLPHAIDLVEPVLAEVLRLSDIFEESKEKNQDPPLWESIYILWMWLELLSLTPFDRRVVLQEPTIPALTKSVKEHLAQAGPIRDTAATCLASWLVRQDMEESMRDFCSWAKVVLERSVWGNDNESSTMSLGNSIFLPLGILQTLSFMLKVGPRSSCYQMQLPLWGCMMELSEQQERNPNMLLRKFLTKWMTRMGCAHMPPRIAPWRYQRGGRTSLLENLTGNVTNNDEQKAAPAGDAEAEQLFEVPDAVEDVMGHLLLSLKDKATVVRWSAAKGIGRLTERLPLLCAHDVLDALVGQLHRNTENDTVWHGSCLALGELARRGLLLPERLQDVIDPILIPAIHFDIRKGQTSVGAHVRDAACYTYWAFARAYSPAVLKPHVERMSHSLVTASLFDREVNCRRAASAAFQESVGRQGAQNFPNGIEILTTADYYTLGNRNASFTSVAAVIAGFEEYRRPIIDHLQRVKLFHWDITIRILASKSLHDLVGLDLPFTQETVLPHLLAKCTDSDLFVRHGAVLGMAEIVLAMKSSIPEDAMLEVTELVPKLEKLRLYRGRGGEVMRAAVCRYTECLSLAQLPLTVKQQVRLLDSVDENLKHPNEGIQQAAGAALAALMRSYFPVREKGPSKRLQERVVDKYVNIIKTSDHPGQTRGYALALGALPKKLLSPSSDVLDGVIGCLCRAARYDAKVGKQSDAETRRNAIQALGSICREVGFEESLLPPAVGLSEKNVRQVFEAFLLGLEDYNTDRRGDVGSWCRISAINGLEQLTYLTVDKFEMDAPLLTRIFGGLLKQLSEKLDNVRACAGGCLERLLQSETPSVQGTSFCDDLVTALQIGTVTNWSDAKATFKRVLKAMNIPELFQFIVSGVIISFGALTESVTKEAEEAVIQWIRDVETAGKGTLARVEMLGNAFVVIFHRNERKRRVILPLLKTMENLFNRGLLDSLLSKQELGFAPSVLKSLRVETQICGDVHRLLASTGVALGLLSHLNESIVNNTILEFLVRMLRHKFPRVRKYTADNLYVRLLEDPLVLPAAENESDVLNLLLEGDWQSDLLSERQLNQLCSRTAELMQTQFTPSLLSVAKEPSAPRDEFASYEHLVNSTM